MTLHWQYQFANIGNVELIEVWRVIRNFRLSTFSRDDRKRYRLLRQYDTLVVNPWKNRTFQVDLEHVFANASSHIICHADPRNVQ